MWPLKRTPKEVTSKLELIAQNIEHICNPALKATLVFLTMGAITMLFKGRIGLVNPVITLIVCYCYLTSVIVCGFIGYKRAVSGIWGSWESLSWFGIFKD